jgi:plasmid maintenance system antidote protein VapI
MLHIGQLIRERMKEDGRSVKWFAEQLNCHRSRIYKIYKNPTIDTALLYRICGILKYNFFKHCSEELALRRKNKE